MAEDLTNALNAAFEKLGVLAMKYGPPAIDTAASVTQVNAIGHLVVSVAACVAGSALAVVGWRINSAGRAASATYWKPETPRGAPDGINEMFVGGIMGAPGAVGCLFGIAGLLDIWSWVALWNPKLALAAKIVNALPGIGS